MNLNISGGSDSALAQMISQMARNGQLGYSTTANRTSVTTNPFKIEDGGGNTGGNVARPVGFTIRNASSETADIDIFDEISPWMGVDAKQVCREIRGIKAKRINVNLNSPGGDYFDGVAIYNALRKHPAQISVSVDGLAASAASIIAMAGDSITMSQGSQMMIHDASSYAAGNAADMRKRADLLDKCSEDIAAIYADRRGGTAETWRALMREETWFTVEEAVQAGLADAELPEAVAAEVEDRVMDWLETRKEWGAYLYAGRIDAPAPHMIANEAESKVSSAGRSDDDDDDDDDDQTTKKTKKTDVDDESESASPAALSRAELLSSLFRKVDLA